MHYFEECLHILLELKNMEQLTQSDANCVEVFFIVVILESRGSCGTVADGNRRAKCCEISELSK